MEVDVRQFILLAIAVIVPLFLLKTRRTGVLLGWVCLTMMIQIFDTAIITNLPPGRIVGLIYIPQAIKQFRSWLQHKPAKAWLMNYCYLIILGIMFGFLWPWPDITMSRPFNLTAPGRTIIFLVRVLSDISLTIFVANEFARPGSIIRAARMLVVGSTLSAAAGLLQFATRVDLYNIITGMGQQILAIDRSRGLAGEPRGLGLICAYGAMILLLGQRKLYGSWILLLIINIAGMLATYSASSLALFATGIVTAWLFFSNWVRGIVLGGVGLTAALLLAASIYLPSEFAAGVETVQLRMDPTYKLQGIAPGSFGQEIAYRLDVFDASALLFLIDEPIYAISGTGPGLVSLPASYHVPPGLYSLIWTPEVGINSLPFHGLLLELTNSGLIGLFCWLVQVSACWAALRYLYRNKTQKEEKDEAELAYALFMIGSVFYMVQVSSSPIWSLFLGIGWAAVKLSASSTGLNKNEDHDWRLNPGPALQAPPRYGYQGPPTNFMMRKISGRYISPDSITQ